MARSPSRPSAILPPSMLDNEKHRWQDNSEQYHQSYTMPSHNARNEMHRPHIPARLHKSPPADMAKEATNSSSGKQDDSQAASRGMVIFSVLFYLVAALVMVIANKWVLNSVRVPLFFLFVQLAIAVLLLHISALFGYFTIPKVHWSTCKGLLPLISINVTGLIFNTYCLQYVDASFYQVARGLVLPFTVLFSYLLLSTRSSGPLLFSVGVVCIGFFLGVTSQHINASPIGTLLGVFSSLTTSVHAIVVKKSLSVVKGSTMDLVYYNNLLSAILLFPLVYLSGESTTVLEMVAVGGAPLRTFLTGATITGVFGFLICIAGFLSIKVTSPVTHMISSAVRGVIQTFLGKWIFGDIITAGRGFGILFILLGSTLYTYIKDREQRQKEQIASHGRSSPALSVSTSIRFPNEKSHGISSAHNSPVLSSSSTFDSISSLDPHSRSSTMSLGINTTLANSAGPSSTIPSPRTPHNLSNRQSSCNMTPPDVISSEADTIVGLSEGQYSPQRRLSYDGRRLSSSALLHSTSPKRPGHQQNGRSYQGPKSISTAAHEKSFSVTDLQDVVIAPSRLTRQKDEKVY